MFLKNCDQDTRAWPFNDEKQTFQSTYMTMVKEYPSWADVYDIESILKKILPKIQCNKPVACSIWQTQLSLDTKRF